MQVAGKGRIMNETSPKPVSYVIINKTDKNIERFNNMKSAEESYRERIKDKPTNKIELVCFIANYKNSVIDKQIIYSNY